MMNKLSLSKHKSACKELVTILTTTCDLCLIFQKAVGVLGENRGAEEERCGERVSPSPLGGKGLGRVRTMPLPQKIFQFFCFRIVHFGAFSYTNSKVLFAIKCTERYRYITASHGILGN